MAIPYIGRDRRMSSPEEREQFAMENGKTNGGSSIALSPTALGALLMAVLGAAGGGGFALRSQNDPHATDVAVLKQQMSATNESLREVKDRLRELDRKIERLLERGR